MTQIIDTIGLAAFAVALIVAGGWALSCSLADLLDSLED